MPDDWFEHTLERNATISGSGAYPYDGIDEEAPDATDSRLVWIAQWVALAAAVVIVPVGAIASAVIASSYHWREFRGPLTPEYSWVAGHGSGLTVAGAFVALALAVAVFAIARGLPSNPRRGAVIFCIIGTVLALSGAIMLLAPGLAMGSAGLARSQVGTGSRQDATIVGCGLLVAAGLLAVAGGLVLRTLARLRKGLERREAEKYRPKN
jgi:hypothetical protein